MKLETGELYYSKKAGVIYCDTSTPQGAYMSNRLYSYWVDQDGKHFDRKSSDLDIVGIAEEVLMKGYNMENRTTELKKQNPNQGRKYDAGKPMYNLIPADALEEVAKVLTAGAIKYNEPIDQENWRLVDNPQPRYFSAAQRHLWADQRGEFIDAGTEESPGTNCYHLACAITSLLFKLQLRIEQEKKASNT